MDDMDAARTRRDHALSARLAEGDMAALEEVYDAYSGPLFRLSVALLGSAADAEDVLQNIFLKLVRRKGGPVKDLGAYLFSSVRNESYSVLRQRRRITFTEDEEPYAFAEARTEDRDRSAVVEEALQSLPAEQREVVVLRIYEQMTFEEIGKRTKTPGPTAASRYRSALQKLRRLLGDVTHAR